MGSDEAVAAARSVVYDHCNIEHAENWELMESVAGLYNRLVIWDAALFHSATTYHHFTADGSTPTRLVQLFFFGIDLTPVHDHSGPARLLDVVAG